MKGVTKFKELLRRRIREKRAEKAGRRVGLLHNGPVVTFQSSGDTDRTQLLSRDDYDAEDDYDSDFETIEMSEVGSNAGD